MSNKLYTEEQVRRAIDIIDDSQHQLEYYEVLEKLTPIELPTDEEIENSNPYRLGGGNYNASAAHKWQKGVEWMRDKIQGGK